MHAMAYDSARKRVVLFGGRFSAELADTWEWDGANWHAMSPSASPSGRSGHGMAFDSVRKRVVLFGGTRRGVFFSDTWEWDGVTWTERKPAKNPGVRTGHNMAYDASANRVVMFGGRTTVRDISAETWEWDGNTWSLQKPISAPQRRRWFGMAYGAKRARSLVFGGSNFGGTWEYDSRVRAMPAVKIHGKGCKGAFQRVPTLQLEPGQVPMTGERLRVLLLNMPRSLVPPIMLFGLSDKNIGVIRLPFDLGAIGFTGCTLYSSSDLLLPGPYQVRFGGLEWSITIPAATVLQGFEFHLQSTGLRTAVFTNAGSLRIGGS